MFDVYLLGVRVGALSPRGRGVRFSYSREALEDDRLPALSLSLPKRTDAYPDSEAGPFFRNLLPEQAYRRLVAGTVGTTPDNSTALLGAIGGECPGAVSIWPASSAPPSAPEYQPLSAESLAALFDPADRQPLANAVARGRLSLAGAQEKVALLRDAAGTWYLPIRGAITSHILKQPAADFPHILANELLCMELARRSGLAVPHTGLATPELAVLAIERFDRPLSREGQRTRVHQEDFCQVLGVDPERKYETDGGPSLKKCAAVLRRYSGLPADDILRLLRWVGFNYLVGNEDAHAKNLALLYLPEGLRLTPHYDLVSTAVYAGLARTVAMKLGRAWDVRNVQRSDWQRLSGVLEVPWARARADLLDLAARVRVPMAAAVGATGGLVGHSPAFEHIAALAAKQIADLERRLGTR